MIMKQYNIPMIEVLTLNAEDVISTSTPVQKKVTLLESGKGNDWVVSGN